MENEIRENSRIKRFVIHFLMLLLAFACIAPFFMIISTSFLSEKNFSSNGYALFPRQFCFDAYKFVFRNPRTILNSYALTIFTTVVGTAVGMFLMKSTAYPLSRPDYKFKGPLSFYVYFTMLFNGGMVANYIWITRYLNLYNSVWALILPGLMSASNLLILRTFFKTVPMSLIESAKLEGASEFRIYLTIVIPLAKAGIATIMLITAFTYWNEWMRSMLYMDQGDKLTIQYYLVKILEEVNLAKEYSDMMTDTPPANESVRMAICLLAAGPMTAIFPFFQKYFVKGITVGSVKG